MTDKTSELRNTGDESVRLEIVAMGNVQQVGYRALVMEYANEREISGFVENLPNGTVHIVAEGAAGTLDTFIHLIRIDNGMVKVRDLEVSTGTATGEYTLFSVLIPDIGYEMFRGFATAKRYLDHLGDKVDKVGDRVDGVGDKIDQFRDESNSNFQRLDDKYHVVSEDLHGMHGEMKGMRGDMKGMRGDMHGMRSDIKSVKTDIKAIRHAVETA